MMPTLVSIIIPVYNCVKFIPETLESVMNQTFRNFEVLIVDDGSTDGSDIIAKTFTARDRRIKYIHQHNQGVSAARNNGFRASCGKFIAFLDADDVWFEDNLQAKIERFSLNDVGMVHSDAIIIDEYSRKSSIALKGMDGHLLDALLLWDGTQVPGPSSVLIRREVLEAVGLFDEDMSTAADKDLFIRIAAQSKIGRIDRVTWCYRVHGNNMHKNLRVMERDVLRLYSKAHESKLFRTTAFKRKCFAAMYLVLAASWAGDGKDFGRALLFLTQAVRTNPQVILNVVPRLLKRWVRK